MNGNCTGRRSCSPVLLLTFLLAGCASGATTSPSSPAATTASSPMVATARPTATPARASSPTGQMTVERGLHTATLLADGRVLVVGGFTTGLSALASAELFDPATGAFSPTGSMATGRAVQIATLLQDGRVLVAGGASDTWDIHLASAEVYDPGSGSFSATGPMAAQRIDYFDTATLLADGRVLVAGGQGEDRTSTSPRRRLGPEAGGASARPGR